MRRWRIDLDTDTLVDLPSITASTRVVWWTADKLLPEPHGRGRAQGIAKPSETLYGGIGHFAMIEDPAAFAAALPGFLNGR